MDLTQYVIIGAIVSFLVQIIKNRFGTDSNKTLGVVVGLSVILGVIYYFIKETVIFEPIISIFGFAGAVYTFLIKRFE